LDPEPINIFSRRIDPRGVVELLRRLGKRVEVAGPDDDWTEATVAIPTGFWRTRQLVFGHNSEYYDGPDWPKQVFGMGNYFSGFPDVAIKSQILRAISQFRFSLAFPRADLDIDSDDPRCQLVFAVCKHLDGMIFTPSSLRDAAGRILIDAASNSDPQARLPVLAPSDGEPEPENEEESEPRPPSAERVAKRAMVLAAVAERGLLEREAFPGNKDKMEQARKFHLARIRAIGVDDEPEPDEWELLQRPVGTLDDQAVINAVWRIEGLIVLAWSLGWLDLPAYDELVVPTAVADALILVDDDQAKEMIARATLRTREEIAALNEHLLAFHWRMRNYRLRPTAMDFVAFSQNCWFGSFDISKFRVLDGDLAIGANPIGKASPDELSICGSIAQERHLAINWLRGYSQIYSETDTST
jgi:hypothetical protein